MNCIVCGSGNVENIGHVGERDFSITSDIKLCNLRADIYICNNCGHLQKFHSDYEKKYIADLYKNYEPHYLSGGNEPLIYLENGMTVPRSYFALEKFVPLMKKNNGKLLDIGTGNGNVIKSAQKLLDGWSLNAFDVTDTYKNEILNIKGVDNFYSGSINNITDNKFDVITMWHSIEHIIELADVLSHIKKILNDDGILIIQVPDIMRSPFDFSVIDHCSHFSNETLRYLLNLNGFQVELDGSDWIYNCLTLAFKKVCCTVNNNFKKNEQLFKKRLLYLNEIIKYFKTETDKNEYLMFGTGISSICIYSQMSRKPSFFIDEDKGKHGSYIDNIGIFDIDKITENSLVIFPFLKDSAFNIIEKINKNLLKPFIYKCVNF